MMTTLVIEKMHGVLLKIWKSQGTLTICNATLKKFQRSVAAFNEASMKLQWRTYCCCCFSDVAKAETSLLDTIARQGRRVGRQRATGSDCYKESVGRGQ